MALVKTYDTHLHGRRYTHLWLQPFSLYLVTLHIFGCYIQQRVAAALHAFSDADSPRDVANAGQEVCTLLHVATFGSVIACLLRHFRASLASLPLLSQPVGNLPIGTWAPTSRQAQQEEGTMPEVCHAACRHLRRCSSS